MKRGDDTIGRFLGESAHFGRQHAFGAITLTRPLPSRDRARPGKESETPGFLERYIACVEYPSRHGAARASSCVIRLQDARTAIPVELVGLYLLP
jgi:hypothetical protein